MKFKKCSVVLLIFALCMGSFSTTIFAYVNENTTEEAVIEELALEAEPTQEPMEPLTPDGNLTLMDDEGVTLGSGKQFITAVTKNGNYFYIIIDRDDKGEQTVHFLNQVDEADLLKLMDEKEVEAYVKMEETSAPKSEESEPVLKVDEQKEAVAEEKMNVNVMPPLLALFALMGGGSLFIFKKAQKKKKEKEAEKPDPDADYMDEEDDYGYSEEHEENEPNFVDDEEYGSE